MNYEETFLLLIICCPTSRIRQPILTIKYSILHLLQELITGSRKSILLAFDESFLHNFKKEIYIFKGNTTCVQLTEDIKIFNAPLAHRNFLKFLVKFALYQIEIFLWMWAPSAMFLVDMETVQAGNCCSQSTWIWKQFTDFIIILEKNSQYLSTPIIIWLEFIFVRLL